MHARGGVERESREYANEHTCIKVLKMTFLSMVLVLVRVIKKLICKSIHSLKHLIKTEMLF